MKIDVKSDGTITAKILDANVYHHLVVPQETQGLLVVLALILGGVILVKKKQ